MIVLVLRSLMLCMPILVSNGFTVFGSARHRLIHVAFAGDNDKMEAVISQLSSTLDDTDRRQQLVRLFQENMTEDDDENESFTYRFETTLMKQGERVQTQARQDAENATDSQKKELWALVDLMVQSKVLIKEYKSKKTTVEDESSSLQ